LKRRRFVSLHPDSRYLNETGIFQEQAAFMAEDGGDVLIIIANN